MSLTNHKDALLVDSQPVPSLTCVLPEVCVGDVVHKEVVSVSPEPGGQPGTVPDLPVLLAPDQRGPGPGRHRAGENELLAQPSVDCQV